MPIEYAFLERIGGRSALSPDLPPPGDISEAVREHLVLLLNTRQGSLPHMPDYGMPDITKYYKGFPDSLADLAAAIAATLRRYEPRIRGLEVELETSDTSQFEATFRIKGWLAGMSGDEEAVVFQTVVSGNGRAKVDK